MDMNETLFKRTLVKPKRHDFDESENKIAEEVLVTREMNGFVMWYAGPDVQGPRIIAWSKYSKDDLIYYAARIERNYALLLASEGSVTYDIPDMHKSAPDREALKDIDVKPEAEA